MWRRHAALLSTYSPLIHDPSHHYLGTHYQLLLLFSTSVLTPCSATNHLRRHHPRWRPGLGLDRAICAAAFHLQTSRRIATRRDTESARPSQLTAVRIPLCVVPNAESSKFYCCPRGIPRQDSQNCAKSFGES